jgi:hypothetical protein
MSLDNSYMPLNDIKNTWSLDGKKAISPFAPKNASPSVSLPSKSLESDVKLVETQPQEEEVEDEVIWLRNEIRYSVPTHQ